MYVCSLRPRVCSRHSFLMSRLCLVRLLCWRRRQHVNGPTPQHHNVPTSHFPASTLPIYRKRNFYLSLERERVSLCDCCCVVVSHPSTTLLCTATAVSCFQPPHTSLFSRRRCEARHYHLPHKHITYIPPPRALHVHTAVDNDACPGIHGIPSRAVERA